MIFNYNKLVRDKIIQNIQGKGHNAIYSILGREEYFKELDKKLIEEVNEFIKTHNEEENKIGIEHSEEEMADIMEVISRERTRQLKIKILSKKKDR